MTDKLSLTEERARVRHRVLRLQRAIGLALRDGGAESAELPLGATLAIESELIGLRQEARIEGKREGFLAGQAAARENIRAGKAPPPVPADARRPRSHTPLSSPPPAPSGAVTPLHPTDWVGGRR